MRAPRPKPWTRDLRKGFDKVRLDAHIQAWADYMGLSDWTIRFSLAKVEPDCRANVDIDAIHRQAAIRLHNGLPPSQVDRLIVHELGHVRMALLEDLLNRALVEHGEQVQAFFGGSWARAQEPICEWLAELLTGQPREEFASSESWESAFPVSG